AGVLINRNGKPVPVENQQKLAYAIWEYGRSTNVSQQVATMLYVHSLMGDARPGELDPSPLGPAVASLYREIARAAARYHGPYRIEARLSGRLAVASQGTATLRLLSPDGYARPDVP